MTDEEIPSHQIVYPNGTMPVGSIVITYWLNEDGDQEWDLQVDFESDNTLSTVPGLLEMAKLRYLFQHGFGDQLMSFLVDEEEEDDEDL